jgi:hypothetical protein
MRLEELDVHGARDVRDREQLAREDPHLLDVLVDVLLEVNVDLLRGWDIVDLLCQVNRGER